MTLGPVQHGVINVGFPAHDTVPSGSGSETFTTLKQTPEFSQPSEQGKLLSKRDIAEFDPLHPVDCPKPSLPTDLEILSSRSEIRASGKHSQTVYQRLAHFCFSLLSRLQGKKEQPLIDLSVDRQQKVDAKAEYWEPRAEYCQPLEPEQIWKQANITEEDLEALDELRKVAIEGGDTLDNSVAERIWKLLSRMATPLKPVGRGLEKAAGKVISKKRLQKMQAFLKRQLKGKVKYEVNQNLGRRAIQLLLLTGASSVLGSAAPVLPILLKLWRVTDVWREGKALYYDKNPVPALKDASVNLLPWMAMNLLF